jgi:transglycosylase-like protein with SLT domain
VKPSAHGAPDPRLIVPFPHNLSRKPSKLTLGMAAATVTASAVAAGLLVTSPGNHAAQAADLSPAAAGQAHRAAVATQPPYTASARLIAGTRGRQAEQEIQRQARRAAARKAARRRAARRRAAARRAALLRAQQRQAAQNQAAGSTGQPGGTGGAAAPSGSPQQIAMGMLGSFGWSASQFGCLQTLWNAESGWNPQASNPSSGAYGIPQALPGSKMASAGPDWQTNPATQIRWGLGYIRSLYGSPCGAWSHEQSTGWY